MFFLVKYLLLTNQKPVSVRLERLLDTRHKLRVSMIEFYMVIDRFESILYVENIKETYSFHFYKNCIKFLKLFLKRLTYN